MNGRYKLNHHQAIPVHDLMDWATWFETADRCVANDMVGDTRVSTVFLGLDHQFGNGAPLLFKTLIFGGPMDGESDRYSTWDEAADGHARHLQSVRDAQKS